MALARSHELHVKEGQQFKRRGGAQSIRLTSLAIASDGIEFVPQSSCALHDASTPIIGENPTVVVEDLNTAGRVKNRQPARSIPDADWRMFQMLLESRGKQDDRKVMVLNRWSPSGLICWACGHQEGGEELSIREWRAPVAIQSTTATSMGTRTILTAGRAASQNACGATPKTAPMVAAGCEAPPL